MLLSAHTGPINKKFTLKESIKIISDAGFDAYDLSAYSETAKEELCFGGNWREKALELRKYADSLGIVCNQSHAVMPSSVGEPQKDKELFEEIIWDMEVASVLGAKIIVVHPKQHFNYADNAEELFNINMEFYKSLIPYCEKFNIKIATENMFQWHHAPNCAKDSTCSRAWEFCKYVDAVDSEWIVGCLDLGHTALVEADTADFIHQLGNKRLQALHVHDNNKIHDEHTLPFLRSMDFVQITKALGEIDYKGDFTYELDYFYKNFPKELYPAITKLAEQVGRYLINEIENNRK